MNARNYAYESQRGQETASLLQSLGNRESGALQAFALTVATVIISRIIFHIYLKRTKRGEIPERSDTRR